jgi:hypothetical protein
MRRPNTGMMRILSSANVDEMLRTGLRLERVPGVLQVRADFERGELLVLCEQGFVQEVRHQDVLGPL